MRLSGRGTKPMRGAAAVLPLLAAAAAGAVLRQQASSEALQLANASSDAAAARGGSLRRLDPKLDPKSDSKFFNKDYPQDKSPKAKHLQFGHPFPIVQDSADFDKDFVKDTNEDGGEWHAQETYDTIRNKIDKVKAKVEKLKEDELKKKEQWSSAVKRETKIEKEATKAEADADKAKAQHDHSQSKVDDLVGKVGDKQVGGEIGEQVGDVNKEINDVEGCQKKLREAKAKLAKLIKEREDAKKKLMADQKEAGEDKDNATAAYEAAKKAQYEKMDEQLLKNIKLQESVYQQAVKEYSMSEEEFTKTKSQLDVYAQQLRAIRAKEDPQGGVYVVAKSAAGPLASPALPSLVLALMAAAAMLLPN